MLRFSILVVYAVGLLLTAGSAPAVATEEQAAEAQAQQIIDAGNRTIALLIERFRPTFPRSEMELLSTNRIRVVVLADFNAFANYKERRILIPAQFVTEIFGQTQAILMVLRDPSLQERYLRWIEYLSKRSIDVRSRAIRNGTFVDDEAVKPFWTHARLRVPQPLSSADAAAQELMMTDTLALVVAHELGHLVLKHRSYDEVTASESRQQEYAADAFAASLLQRSGMSVIPGLNTFILRFAANEALTKGVLPEERTHPPAECRFYRLGNPAIEELIKSPDRRRDFERTGNISVEQFRDTMRTLRPQCAP